MIINDLHLPLNGNPKADKTLKKIEIPNIEKQDSKIQIKKRNWNENIDKYWLEYYIPFELCDLYNVKPLLFYWVNDNLVYSHDPKDPAYSYEGKQGKRKILRPYGPSKYKWINNLKKDFMFGIEQLCNTDLCIITKSLKDVMVYRLFNIDAVCVQSENTTSLPEIEFNKLKKRYNKILLNFDNDSIGIKNAEILSKKYNLPLITTPYKDVSTTIKQVGQTTTKEIIYNLINNV
jgi:hypothetical protein